MKPTLISTTLIFIVGLFGSFAAADHPPASIDIICLKVEDIKCASADMKDEIKAHFRGAKGYGRMLGTNALIKAKASAIHRRVNRDRCYRQLEKDVARLNELACELQERFEEVLNCSTLRRPVYGELGHVQAKINSIRNLADCVQVEACRRLGKPIPVELRHVIVDRVVVPPVVPEYQFAPGPRFIEPLNVPPTVEPVVPQRQFKSVLETNDPIILPPDW
jgi:hypothetical protein